MAKQPQETPAAGAEVPKKKRGKLMLVAGILVFATGAGGAGAWYFTRPVDPNAPKAAESAKPAVFLPLESFTVNLVAHDGQAQYLQAGLTLKLAHDVKSDVIKERMPEIRNRILLVLSGKKAGELLPVTGKHKLANELSDAIRDVLGASAGLKSAARTAAAAEDKSDSAKAATEEGKADAKAADATKAATRV